MSRKKKTRTTSIEGLPPRNIRRLHQTRRELAAEAANSERVIAEWVVSLNQAIIQIRSGELESAIQQLRSIEAPS